MKKIKARSTPRPPAGNPRERAPVRRQDLCEVRCVHQDRVDKARQNAISRRDLHRLARVYKTMGDPTRLNIIMALMQGEMCVCDLAAFLGMTESATSHQLARLRDQALVKNRREGKVLYYSLDDDHVLQILQVGMEHVRE